MSDTRYSAEELREWAQESASNDKPVTSAMLNQAARDAETLAGIRAFILKYSHPDEFDKHAIAYGQAVLAHMDKLMANGDA